MSSAAGVEAEIASVITGIILLFSACSFYIRHKMDRLGSKSEEKKSETLTETKDKSSSIHKDGKQEEKKIESTETKEDNKWN